MADNQSLWYLENIDVSGIFCPRKFGGASDDLFHKSYKKGEYIYMPDEHADKMYLISEGRVKIGHYGETGKEITKAIITKGEVFGELAIIGQDVRRDFAYTLDKTNVCIISVDEMKSLMKDHSNLSIFFLNIIGSRKLEIEKRLESLVFRDSRSRIIEFLIYLNEKSGERIGYEYVVRKFITHQEIANMTATSRQTVTTILNELRNKNFITFDRRRLLIRDLEALQEELNVAA